MEKMSQAWARRPEQRTRAPAREDEGPLAAFDPRQLGGRLLGESLERAGRGAADGALLGAAEGVDRGAACGSDLGSDLGAALGVLAPEGARLGWDLAEGARAGSDLEDGDRLGSDRAAGGVRLGSAREEGARLGSALVDGGRAGEACSLRPWPDGAVVAAGVRFGEFLDGAIRSEGRPPAGVRTAAGSRAGSAPPRGVPRSTAG